MRVSVRSIVLILVLVAASATVLLAADPPYVGKWKLNPAKSDFGETTVTYEQMASGKMKVTADGQSYTFRTDGKDYPTPWGIPAAWKAVNANTESTNKTNGKVMSTATLRASSPRPTRRLTGQLTEISSQTPPDTRGRARQ